MGTLISERDFGGVAKAMAQGIQRGRVLRDWWNASPSVDLRDLPGCRPDSHMQYFFDRVTVEGVLTPISGCLQTSTFTPRSAAGEAISLADWVGENFLHKARWTEPNGWHAGFSYRPVAVADLGRGSSPRPVEAEMPLRLDEIGSRYEWASVRLDLRDYMKAIPVMGKFPRLLEPMNREAGYLVIHSDFFGSPIPPPRGCAEEFTFGYTVAPWVVMPTIAAYGPGRFHSAFKQFRFFLMEDGSVKVQVLFLVAPQCTKMLNLLGFDPVFHPARAVDAITGGSLGLVKRVSFAVNHYAMGHHARVHDMLLTGMRQIWEETPWRPGVRERYRRPSSGR